MKHHIKCENVWTNSALVKHYYQMFQLPATVPNLCPQPKSTLINHNNDRLLDA